MMVSGDRQVSIGETGPFFPMLREFSRLKTELPSRCRECEYLSFCRGGCPKHHRPIGTDPDRYNHWKLEFEGPVARLTMAVDENRGLKPGYQLKLNSYDLGVDIEIPERLDFVIE